MRKFLDSAGLYRDILSSYRRRKLVLDYFPPLLWVEPTNKCNLRCAMCPNSVLTGRETGCMEMETLERIVDEFSALHPHGTGTIALFLGGEPLLHDRIFEMIRYARERGLQVNLATNATLLTVERVGRILDDPPTLLIVSFDGYDRESYEQARAGASFEKTLANVQELLRTRERRGARDPAVRLYSLVLDTERLAEETGKFLRFYRETFQGMAIDEILIQGANGWAGLFDGSALPFFTPDRRRGGRYRPCVRLWYTMSILWDGTVVPCCSDFTGEVRLGDARSHRLTEIWNDRPYREMRRTMAERRSDQIPLCSRGCEVLYPTDVLFGIPGELLIHRKAIRDFRSRRLARAVRRRK